MKHDFDMKGFRQLLMFEIEIEFVVYFYGKNIFLPMWCRCCREKFCRTRGFRRPLDYLGNHSLVFILWVYGPLQEPLHFFNKMFRLSGDRVTNISDYNFCDCL